MRMQCGPCICPKCGHEFMYDSGQMEFIPFKTKKDAEDFVEWMEDEYPNTKHSIEPYEDGWIIHGESK